MTSNLLRSLTLCLSAMAMSLPLTAHAQTQVLVDTPLGNFVVELYDDVTPNTVANFLQYIEDGDFNNSFIHRSVPNFVIQGGAFTFTDGEVASIPADPPIQSEFQRSNLRGTIAMALLQDQPDSGTSSWFINTEDNTGLDDQQFTVFGEVIGDGMEVVDAIAQLQRWNAGQSFQELPLIDYPGGDTVIDETHLVFTQMSVVTGIPFNAGLNGSWFNAETSGQGFFLDYFPDIELALLAWFTYDTTLPEEGATSSVGDPGNRWITAQGPVVGNVGDLEVIITSGGLFNDPDSTATNTRAGTISLAFEDCSNGLVTYNMPAAGLSGTVAITRLANDNVALCEQLDANGGVLSR